MKENPEESLKLACKRHRPTQGARMCDWQSSKQFCLCKIVQGTWFESNVPRGTFLIK